MPTFRANRPPSIADSIRAMVGSSPNLSPLDELKVEHSVAQTAREGALAEKARQEIEAAREADRLRRDPAAQDEYAATVGGTTMPIVRDLRAHIRGETVPLATTVDDEGNAMPPTGPYAAPSKTGAMSPEVERSTRSALGSTLANLIATGKTNAEQLTHAGGNLLTNATRVAMQDPALSVPDANRLGVSINQKAREPFKQGPLGVLNEETGALDAAAAKGQNAPAGYRWTQDGSLEVIPGGPAEQAHVPAGYRRKPDGSVEPIPGGPAQIGKALPNQGVTHLAAAGEAVEGTTRLAATFKPEFGGKTILGDLSNTYKRVLGDETGQAQWWQDMDALQNQTRHALFGSALTATELAAWNKTAVTPRMDPDEIQKNLMRRQAIEARAASKLGRAYAAGGYNQDQIKELLGVGAGYLDVPAAPVTTQNPPRGAADIGGPKRAPRATAPKEGATGTSKSGRPIIFKGGAWVYNDEAGI